MPNYNSILGKKLGPLFLKYANTLTLSNTWQFFSPDPTVEFYFEYQIEMKKNDFDEEPDEKDLEEMAVDDLDEDLGKEIDIAGAEEDDEEDDEDESETDEDFDNDGQEPKNKKPNYLAESEDDIFEKEMKVYRWPPKKNTFLYRPSYFRRIYHSRLSSRDEYRKKKFFIPWLCKLHQNAERIHLRNVLGQSPIMHESDMEKKLESRTNFEYQVIPVGSYECNEEAVEG